MTTTNPQQIPRAGRARRSHHCAGAKLLRTVDGRRFAIRRMRRDDRVLYEAGVAALSERSRYLRFASPISKLSTRLVDQLMDLDDHRHVAYVALTPDRRTLLGVARYVRLADDPNAAEVAIAIADEWQRVGVGALLLNRLIGHAHRSGIHSLVAVTLSENHGAKALARDAGFAARGPAGIYTDHRLEVADPRL
jgi:RimJ/RimL family protein N-acetyltransferase